jgi:hypothetical protein
LPPTSLREFHRRTHISHFEPSRYSRVKAV